jgi:hypothetical protein
MITCGQVFAESIEPHRLEWAERLVMPERLQQNAFISHNGFILIFNRCFDMTSRVLQHLLRL